MRVRLGSKSKWYDCKALVSDESGVVFFDGSHRVYIREVPSPIPRAFGYSRHELVLSRIELRARRLRNWSNDWC